MAPALTQGSTLQEPQQQQQGSTQLPGHSLSAQKAEAQAIAQRPWLQSQGQGQTLQPPSGQGALQQPPGRLQNAPSGVPLEHRSKTIRTMSFRQVVRSASEGDAMSLQTEPATALQVLMLLPFPRDNAVLAYPLPCSGVCTHMWKDVHICSCLACEAIMQKAAICCCCLLITHHLLHSKLCN